MITNTTGLDAFIDGHSHSTIEMEMVTDQDGNAVVLTKTGSSLDAVGKLTIGTDGTITTQLLSAEDLADLTPDPQVTKLEDRWILPQPTIWQATTTPSGIWAAVSPCWLVNQFKDWAFYVTNTFFYYLDYDRMTVEQRNTMQMGMAAFGGNAPTYHIALYEKPTIVWDFHSMMLGIHMMFSFLLTDENHPMKLCKHCHKVFIAKKPDAEFCSTKCRNSFQKK